MFNYKRTGTAAVVAAVTFTDTAILATYLFIYIIKSYAKYTVNDKKEKKDKDKIKKNSTQFT